MTDPRTQLVVLFGGQSAEHDISCISARHVLAAVDTRRYDVRPIAIDRDGRWLDAVETAEIVRHDPTVLPPSLAVSGPEVDPITVVRGDGRRDIVVFPLLHGPMGEDGTVQGLLEVAGVPYVGCGVLASAVAMDKATAKEVLAFHGIPQVRWTTVRSNDLIGDMADPSADDLSVVDPIAIDPIAIDPIAIDPIAIDPIAIDRIAADLGFPVFVKPANMGSSIGITKAHDRGELLTALATAMRFDEWIVCEEAVTAREIECAALGNAEVRISAPGEIIPGAEFYDYEDKYSTGTAQLRIPAELPDGVADELATLAARTYRALRCEGMARVDFFYENPGRGLLVNEVNTIPGFTPISMYPRMWAASGLDYPSLVDELIRLAIERHSRRMIRRRT